MNKNYNPGKPSQSSVADGVFLSPDKKPINELEFEDARSDISDWLPYLFHLFNQFISQNTVNFNANLIMKFAFKMRKVKTPQSNHGSWGLSD